MRGGQLSNPMTSTTTSTSASSKASAPVHVPGAKGEVMASTFFPDGLPQTVLRYLGGDVAYASKLSVEKRNEYKFFGRNFQEAILDELATQAATLLLGGEEKEVAAVLAVVRKNPGILHRRVVARDRLGSPALCLMTPDARPQYDLRLMSEMKDTKVEPNLLYVGIERSVNSLCYKVITPAGKEITTTMEKEATTA